MKTKIICILDRSGSMSSIIEDAIGGFNTFLKEQQELDDVANMDIFLFDTEFSKVVNNVDIKNVKPMTNKTYVPRGGTALYDAIGKTIDSELDFLAQNPNNRPDKTLCVILTDGEENSSREYSREKIKMMIEEMEKEFKWNFIFLAANQDAIMTAGSIGIAAGKSMNFAANGEGITVAYQKISKAASYYRTTNQSNYNNIFVEIDK
ncbi:MAG: VWA domain-containing protein [Ignavibacteria bacterium]|nr:VWA domain-containing protein [Ignavibacteria bacterium]